MDRLHDVVRLGGEKGEQFMLAGTRGPVRSANAFPTRPDAGEEEQRLAVVQSEPVKRFAPRHGVRRLSVFREGRGRDHASVFDSKPLLPMSYPRLADIGDACVGRLG